MGMFSTIGGLVGGYFGMPGVGTAVGGLLDSNKATKNAEGMQGQVAVCQKTNIKRHYLGM